MSVTIPAGRINRLFGTDGGVMLSLYADFPAQFDTGTPLLVTIVGLEFRIECDEDEDDEFYLEDLIGFAVTCTEAGADGAKGAAAFTGSVTDYYDSDANPLFELEIGGRTVLVPAAEEFIAHIDFGGRTMKLVLPEGLLDL